MDSSSTLLWIFLAVWVALVFLSILFQICGGRLADCVSCDCCAGPCGDCWGAGGQIDELDREYPFPFARRDRAVATLPPIVIVNTSEDDDDDDERGSPRTRRPRASDNFDGDEIEYRDDELDEGEPDALLLRSNSNDERLGNGDGNTVVVG